MNVSHRAAEYGGDCHAGGGGHRTFQKAASVELPLFEHLLEGRIGGPVALLLSSLGFGLLSGCNWVLIRGCSAGCLVWVSQAWVIGCMQPERDQAVFRYKAW